MTTRTAGVRALQAPEDRRQAAGVGAGVGAGRAQDVVGAADDRDQVGLELDRLGELLEHLGAGRAVDREVAEDELGVAAAQPGGEPVRPAPRRGSQPVPAVKLSPSAT